MALSPFNLITHWNIVLFPSDLGFSGFGDFIVWEKNSFLREYWRLRLPSGHFRFLVFLNWSKFAGMKVLITRKKLGWSITMRARRRMLRGGLYWVCSVCAPLPCSRTLEMISQQPYNNDRSSWVPSYCIPDIALGTSHELIQFILTVVLHAKYPIILILQIKKLLKLSNLYKPTNPEIRG